MSDCYNFNCPFRVNYLPTSCTRCDSVGCYNCKPFPGYYWYSDSTGDYIVEIESNRIDYDSVNTEIRDDESN